jgi:hypothetical protein
VRVVTDPADPRMYCHRSDALMADPRNRRYWHEPVCQFGSFFFPSLHCLYGVSGRCPESSSWCAVPHSIVVKVITHGETLIRCS